MVVIGRFGAFCAKAAGGGRRYGLVKRSAHRCDGLHAALMARLHLWSCCVVCCGAAARARDRALFAALDAVHKQQLTNPAELSLAVAAEAG